MKNHLFVSIDEKTRKEFVAGLVIGAICLGSLALVLLIIFSL